MRRDQCIHRLKLWNTQIAKKNIILGRASKMFSLFNYFLKINEAACSVLLLTLNSFLISEIINDGSLSVFLGLSITTCVLQCILAIITAIDGVMNPGKKAHDCGVCSKQYHQLQLEINVMIDDLIGLDIDELHVSSNELEKYSYLCLMIQQKEQIILNEEPRVYFTKLKTSITHSSNSPRDYSSEIDV